MPWSGYDGRCDGVHDDGAVEVGGVDVARQDVMKGGMLVSIRKYQCSMSPVCRLLVTV
jgi:hypothetical protein